MDSAEFLGLPARVAKPRQVGLTHVMDKGLGLDAIRSMVEMSGDYIDIVKLGPKEAAPFWEVKQFVKVPGVSVIAPPAPGRPATL